MPVRFGSSRHRNLAILLCGAILILFTFSTLSEQLGIWLIRGGAPEKWPPGTFAGWRTKGDGKVVVPISVNGVAIPLNSTSSSIWKRRTKHPIYSLIQEAEEKWKGMLQRQSKTLRGAVLEYQRRYNRLPPKGFDEWYAFAKSKNLILIDEFDLINYDISPFLALSPRLAQQRRDQLRKKDGTYHMNYTSGKLHLLSDAIHAGRSLHLLAAEFENALPDMVIHTHVHDMAPYMIDQRLRREVENSVRRGKFISSNKLKKLESPTRNDRQGILKGCVNDAPSVKPQIKNPALLHNQCLFTGQHVRDSELHPLFVQSKVLQGGGILGPSTYAYNGNDGKNIVPWEERLSKVYWRGRSTGCWHQKATWRQSHRVRLHLLANNHNGTYTPEGAATDDDLMVLVEDEGAGILTTRMLSRWEFNARFMDVGLIGPPMVCDVNDGTCDDMADRIDFLERTTEGTKGERYKFTIDVDGNGWSGRYRGLLGSGSVVFKSTMFPEWNTDRMIPYYHYIRFQAMLTLFVCSPTQPIQHDFSDLYSSIAFFTGTPDGQGEHDEVARRIAEHSVDYVLKHWRWEDMQVYVSYVLSIGPLEPSSDASDFAAIAP
ncbi:F-actin-capping protein subunit alpha [Tulasnella sp. 332]|nr:F-actin-capping protein subunit alpha [Tulasnella sp. 332]